MQKTEHYQLNQWEKTDRIMMEDFNADNQKIDAAIASVKPETVLLKEFTAETHGTKFRVSLADVDLSAYRKLIIEPRMLCSDKTTYKLYLNNRADSDSVLLYQGTSLINSDALASLYTCVSLNVTTMHYFCRVTLDLTTPTVLCDFLELEAYQASHTGSNWTFLPARGTSLHKTLPPGEITEVTISAAPNLQAGSTVKIYGVK